MNIGLWGCGGMGNSLAHALTATGEASLGAVYDLLPEAAAGLSGRYGGEATASAEALLAWPGLNGVIIALPGDLHAPAVVQAAAAGLDLFVEKPMSVTVESCVEMLEAVRRSGVKLMVGQVLRYYEPYRSILCWQTEGRFGKPFAGAIWRTMNGHEWHPAEWRLSAARSGGPLLEVGAHELDMLRCLFGQPETVRTVANKVTARGGDWPDFIAVQIGFAGGSTATYESGVGGYASHYGFRLYFEQATLTSDSAFDPGALQIHTADGCQGIPAGEFSTDHPVEAELRGWLAALRGEAPVPVPGEEGLATVALAEAAYRSAATGQVVQYQLPD